MCGDSVECGNWLRGDGQIQLTAVVFNVPDGHAVEFVNGSQKKTDVLKWNNTTVGRFTGSGNIVIGMNARLDDELLNNPNGTFNGTIEACGGFMAATPREGATVRVLGSKLAPKNSQQKIMGFSSTFMPAMPANNGIPNYDSQFSYNSNPGNFMSGMTLYMDGGVAFFTRQQTSAWASGKEGQEAQDAATATNEFDLVLRGDGYFYGYPAHDTSGTYVRPGVFLKSVDNQYGTLTIHGFNFKRNDYSPARGIVKIENPSRYLVGSDPAEGEEREVYKIIPWLTVKYNESGINEFSYNYCGSICFPCIAEDGTLVPPYSEASCVGGKTYMYEGGRSVTDWKDNAVAYLNKQGDWVMKLSADKTLNALAIRNNKDDRYSDAQKGMMGEGRTLTLTSGALILNCNDVGVANAIGGPQYDNGGGNESAKWMKAGRANSGTLKFGNVAYVFDFWGHPDLTKKDGNRQDYDGLWASCVAPYGFVKAGAGELCLLRNQRQIDKFIHVNSGKIRLGYPRDTRTWLYGYYPDACDGCATAVDFILHAGAELSVESSGYDIDGDGTIGADETAISKDAVLTLNDYGNAIAKIEIAEGADQTCQKLYISGRNNGKALKRGTYGATGSGADYIDDVHFAGTGVLTVRKDDAAGMYVIIK